MKLAQKMSRIGTESAFEVLAQGTGAREAGQATSSTWRSASPTSPRPPTSSRPASARSTKAGPKYGPTQGFPELREAIAAYISRTRRHHRRRRERLRRARRQADHVFPHDGAARSPATKSSIPDPSFPIYESLIHFLGATAVGVPVVESRGFSFDLETLRTQPLRQDEAGHPELAGQPDGRRHSRRTTSRRWPRMLRDRDLIVLSDEIYSRIWYENEPTSISQLRRDARQDGHPRRLLEDVFDDRLAARLRRDADVAGRRPSSS